MIDGQPTGERLKSENPMDILKLLAAGVGVLTIATFIKIYRNYITPSDPVGSFLSDRDFKEIKRSLWRQGDSRD